jgi:hypothetical protein
MKNYGIIVYERTKEGHFKDEEKKFFDLSNLGEEERKRLAEELKKDDRLATLVEYKYLTALTDNMEVF